MNIGDDKMNPFNSQLLVGFLCVPHAGGGDNVIAMDAEYLHERLTYRLLIIDDEDGGLWCIASRTQGSVLL
jgi:hypothetical protein